MYHIASIRQQVSSFAHPQNTFETPLVHTLKHQCEMFETLLIEVPMKP